MPEVNYYLRDGAADKKTSVILNFSLYRKRIKICTVDSIHPKFWDNDKQRAKAIKAFPTHPEFNAQLDKKRELALKAYRAYITDNNQQEPSTETLRNIIKSAIFPNISNSLKVKKINFLEFIDQFIEECESGKRLSEKGTPITRGTITIYKTFRKNINDFRNAKKCSLNFEDIDFRFFESLKDYLMLKKEYSTNTLAKHIRTIKLILNEAADRDLTQTRFMGKRYRAKTEQTETIYLNKSELERIYNLDLKNNPRLDRVRDLFLVGCWTGLRFSDFSKLSSQNFINGNIEIKTQKTKKTIVAPIHNTVMSIMKKYENLTENRLPPALSNQKMNEYLKEIGALAGIDNPCTQRFTKAGKEINKTVPKFQLISTHTARRSFATNMYLDNLPTLSIMAITGHTTESSFMKYIRITPKEHAEKLKEHWDKNK